MTLSSILVSKRGTTKVLDYGSNMVTWANLKNKIITFLGVTFKPNTDDMRESPSLGIIPNLQQAGAQIHAYDPEGMTEAKELLPEVTFHENAYDPLEGADALVIITEWNEFRALDLDRVKATMAKPVMVDLRNIYEPGDMLLQGFDYSCIGRPNDTVKK